MDHPENLRHPTWWHARDYGLLAANPFGQHDFEGRKGERKLGEFRLAEGETLTQRYRLVMQAGSIESAKMTEVFDEFADRAPTP